ncbi:4'-phosphopantetheinyl transferase family protein [Pontibacter mangrovi]|uniref:Enterobactin synthase component D n=1 Tax=Pontibacter mangrovi TaxID=2589816 RepID=A0A501W8H3_9BACT|nr:4'-phosphopantetheinyl transferase family protein [Pontibacter mangrovi]TPE44670.1 4'-phosphopantetheinyl transferase superfamily protein [Pontibacter mangrovi]
MPLLQITEPDEHTRLGLWQLTEPIEELREELPVHVAVQEGLEKVHPKRQREWLASRVLVYKMLEEFTSLPIQLLRNQLGKPYFPDSRFHVSISHSPQLAAVILSDKYEVGIDIEPISAKALRVQDKFLTDGEKSHTLANEQSTCLYWSAKETLYKLYSRKQLIFKENLEIKPTSSPNILQGRVNTENFSKLYRIYFEVLHGHVLTYCIDKQPDPHN